MKVETPSDTVFINEKLPTPDFRSILNPLSFNELSVQLKLTDVVDEIWPIKLFGTDGIVSVVLFELSEEQLNMIQIKIDIKNSFFISFIYLLLNFKIYKNLFFRY